MRYGNSSGNLTADIGRCREPQNSGSGGKGLPKCPEVTRLLLRESIERALKLRLTNRFRSHQVALSVRISGSNDCYCALAFMLQLTTTFLRRLHAKNE